MRSGGKNEESHDLCVVVCETWMLIMVGLTHKSAKDY